VRKTLGQHEIATVQTTGIALWLETHPLPAGPNRLLSGVTDPPAARP